MYVFASAHCSVRQGDRIIRLTPGDVWYADDAFVLARPDLFSKTPPVVHGSPPEFGVGVEQATRRPGERRTLPRG